MTDREPSRQMSEWLKVLLGEIERKKAESERAREERQRRAEGTDRTHGK